MKLTYVKSSIGGTWASQSFNKSFMVVVEGVVEKTTSGKGMIHPMFENQADYPTGIPQITVSLPNDRHGVCEIGLEVSIPTPTQGVHDLRPIKKEEIKALRDNWQAIRQEVIEDAFTMGDDVEPLFLAIDVLMTAQKVRLYIPDPDYPAQMRLAYIGTPPKPQAPAQTKPVFHDNGERLNYAVTFAYNERGRYSDETAVIWSMTQKEVEILTRGIVDEIMEDEDLEELSGKFYESAELLNRVSKRDPVKLPATIQDTVLIWLQ